MTSPEEQARQALFARYNHIQSASTSYLEYVKLMYPDFVLPSFQVELIDALDKLERDALFVKSKNVPVRNLLITMPPRHAKSTWATVNFPAYFLGKDPRRDVMSVSYNGTLAKGFGRQVRNIFSEPDYQSVFPSSKISNDKRGADAFSLTESGNYYSIGLNGTTTGRSANLLLIDDPFKSRVEAESQLIRDRVWDFYTASLSNRREPSDSGQEPIQIVILTRWHPDDLAGRIMDSDEWSQGLWHHINFPAISEVPNTNPPQKQALWPERFGLDYLKREQAKSPRDFEALYQQNPVIIGGNLIKSEWFCSYSKQLPSYMSVIITADTAFQTKNNSDYTVFLVAGLTRDGDIHILDVQRGRWDFPTTKRMAIAINSTWRGKGLRGLYIENKASGQSLIQELRSSSGISVLPYNPGNIDKQARVHVITPIIEGGRVYIPEQAPWLSSFQKELSEFPSSKHDDIVDAFVMALDQLSRIGISANFVEEAFDFSRSLNSGPLTSDGKSLSELIKSNKLPRPIGG